MFDAARTGTGTKEWADSTENIQKGCSNDCRYCYAAENSVRFGWRKREDWSREELTKKACRNSYPEREGVIMFPTSHDITPFNVEAYIRVAKLMLQRGNKLLIVTKPRLDCMRRVLHELSPYKEQIMLRFTIGSMNPRVTAFWEPGAPTPDERIECLWLARAFDFNTSISIEPMLGGIGGTMDVVNATRHYVTDTIWIGKMKKIRARVGMDSSEIIEQVRTIESLQSDQEIISLHEYYQNEPMVRWKDSIKDVIASSTKETP